MNYLFVVALIISSLLFLFFKWWFIIFVLLSVFGLIKTFRNAKKLNSSKDYDIQINIFKSDRSDRLVFAVLVCVFFFIIGGKSLNLKPFILSLVISITYSIISSLVLDDLIEQSMNYRSDGSHSGFYIPDGKETSNNHSKKDFDSIGDNLIITVNNKKEEQEQYDYKNWKTSFAFNDYMDGKCERELHPSNKKIKPKSIKGFPIIQTKSFIESVRKKDDSFNHDTVEMPGYLLENGYYDGDLIPVYEYEDLNAKLRDIGIYYMVYVRPLKTEIEWEELGKVERTVELDQCIKDGCSFYVKVDGGSHKRLVEGETRNRLIKEWIPFSYTLIVKQKQYNSGHTL